MQIVKRNGKLVEFESEKIVDAIIKAMAETEEGIDEDLALSIADEIEDEFADVDVIPTVETVQDRIEILLAYNKRFDVSKKYILYRNKRNKLREQGWNMTDLQRDIYEKKYRFNNERFDEFLERVSGGNEPIKKAIKDREFMPAGRVLAGRGLDKTGKKITLSNCHVMPKVEDNIESIFDTAKYLARTYSYGGGCGLNISNLRPKGAKVNNAANTTTGAVSFMELFSLVTSLIGSKGRRGALMLNMDVNHPDIREFIDVKNDLTKITTANISVNIDDKFMKAVENDEEYELYFYVDATGEEISKKVEAKDLFKKLAKNNWSVAEPGILYTNRINSWHLMSEDKTFEFVGVNPCAEEPLPAHGSCNLASINLSSFVERPFEDDAEFNYERFKKLVKNGVIYLNEILDENMNLYPLKEQSDVAKDLRQIGLGIMGLADMFIKLGIRYGSDESIKLTHKIGKTMINEALRTSAYLAKENGPFPRYNRDAILKSPFILANADKDVFDLIAKYGLRNSQLLTIAPTGTISNLANCSNGIEPLFQISYIRKSESLYEEDTYYTVFTPIAKEYMEKYGIYKEEDLPDYFVTTSNLNYKDRLKLQSAWQNYIDASISSTINLANEATVEDVCDIYMTAWKLGLKGITIYRDGCARSGILITDKPKSRLDRIDELKEEMDDLIRDEFWENPDICPVCGGKMSHVGGCLECEACGYSPCSI